MAEVSDTEVDDDSQQCDASSSVSEPKTPPPIVDAVVARALVPDLVKKCEQVTEGCVHYLQLLGRWSKHTKPILQWQANATLLAATLHRVTDDKRYLPQCIVDGVAEALEIWTAIEPILAKAVANKKRRVIDADLNDERTDPDDTSEHTDDPLHSPSTRRMYFSIATASSSSSSV